MSNRDPQELPGGPAVEPRAAGNTLTQRAMTAAQWRLGSSLAQGVVQFGVGVMLARILPPSDFGLVALAMVVIGFAGMLADLGLGPALIQQQPLDQRHVRVAFSASTLLGLGIAAALVAAAPWIAAWLGDASVQPVLRVLAITFALGGVSSTSHSLLRRALDFRRLFVVSLVSYGLGYAAVALVLARLGFGVWSLVWGALAQAALSAGLSYAMVRHPARPLLAGPEIRALLGFGMGFSLTQVVNYVARTGDNVIIGRWLGAGALGLYSRAYNLMTLPLTYVVSTASSVLFPTLSEIRTDRERLGRAYLLSVQVGALVSAPIMAGLIVAAPHLVRGLYGDAWAGAVLPLQILCAAGLFRTVYHLGGALAQASGRVYGELARQTGYAVLVVGGGVVGSRWGLAGVSLAVAGAITFMYLAVAQLSLQITHRTWGEFARAQIPGVVIAAAVSVVGWATRGAMEAAGASHLGILAAIAATSAATVVLGIYLLPASDRPQLLFAHISARVARLPRPLSWMLGHVLRGAPARAA